MRIQSLLYAALNPPMRALLRSPFHGIASRNIALLYYEGRQSGRRYETPLSFVREGAIVLFLSSHETRWWTNFRAGPTPVEVEIGRERSIGRARLLEHDSEPLRDGVRRFLTALPRDAMVYGIGLDRDRRPRESDLAKAASRIILVTVELETGETGEAKSRAPTGSSIANGVHRTPGRDRAE